jgi:hypothetical protein
MMGFAGALGDKKINDGIVTEDLNEYLLSF